jgi:signal transduction histidine kinase
LVGALQQRLDAVEKRSGLETRLLVEGVFDLPPLVEREFYRIIQEALNNTLKHAVATLVTIHLRSEGEKIVLEVIDNGQGFAPETASETGGMGLMNMQERLEKLNGSLTILSSPGQGTRVTAVVPNPNFS